MAIQIKLKNSVVQDSTPSASDLPEVGELAVNANINSIGGFMRASDNSIVKIFGPGSLSTPTATTTVSGISELATNSETTTGTATNRVVTPAGLNAVTVAERTTSNTNYVAKAGSTLTGVLTMPNGSNSAPAINFGDSDSGIFGGTNTVSLAAGGTTRLTADTGVSVTGTLAVTGAITSTSDLTIADKIIHSGDTNTVIRFPAADTVSVETGASEALRVDSSQRLLVGTSSSRAIAGSTARSLQIEGTAGESAISVVRNSSNASGSSINLGKSRSSSVGGNTIVQSGDVLGTITFAGANGTNIQTKAAEIVALVDGTPGATDMPGRLVFRTTADGATSPTERLRISQNGTTTLTGHLDISSGLDVTGAITASTSITASGNLTTNGNLTISGTNPNIFLTDTDNDSDFRISNTNGLLEIRDITNTTTRFSIKSDGKVGIGTVQQITPLELSYSDANASDFTTSANLHDGTNVDLIAGMFKNSGSGNSEVGLLFESGDTQFVQWSINAIKTGSFVGDLAFRTRTAGATSAERMRLTSAGNLGINEPTPLAKLHVKIADSGASAYAHCAAVFEDSDHTFIDIMSGTTGSGGINFGDSGGSQRGVLEYNHNSDFMRLIVANGERMRIDSSGRSLLGTSTARAVGGDSNARLHIEGTGANSWVNVTRFAANSGGPNIQLAKSRSDTPGTYTVVQDGDTLGQLSFLGADGTDMANYAAIIRAEVDGTPGSNDMPGRLVFMTTSDGGTFPTERMQIDASGRVLIGTTTEGTATADDLTIATTGNTGITIRSGTSSNGNIFFSDATSGAGETAGYIQYDHSSDYMRFGTATNERVRIDSSGRLLAGSTTTANNGRIQGFIAHGSTAGESGITSVDTTSMAAGVGGEIAFYGKTSSSGYNYLGHVRGIKENGTDSNTACALTFHTRPTLTAPQERMRIDSSGNVLVGLTTALSTQTGAVQAAGPIISKSYINAHTSNAAVLQYISNKAVLRAYGATSNSGILQFNVGGGGDATDFEAMRIDASGNVGINTTSMAGKLNVQGAAGGVALQTTDATNSTFRISHPSAAVALLSSGSGHVLALGTGFAEKMRIDSSGQVGIGVTSPNDKLHVLGPVTFRNESTNIGSSQMFFDNNESGGAYRIRFDADNDLRGSITVNSSGTTYNTSSDYRLKENITAITDGITRLKTLKPSRFNWKKDSSTTVDGFIAHEVTAVPEAVTGTKDAVATEDSKDHKKGDPIYQQIDQSKLVPLLVAAVQELISKVEKLEAA